jgi:phage terminase Nu1 subunit (DNA packaging protein)
MLTAEELARELKVKVAAIRKWQRAGIPFVPVGRLRRYHLNDAIAWLQEREHARLAKRQQRK